MASASIRSTSRANASPSTSISEAGDASVIMAIVGLPAPLGATPRPAMPVGERTIAQPRFRVNAGQLNSLVHCLYTSLLRSTGSSEKVWRLWGKQLNGMSAMPRRFRTPTVGARSKSHAIQGFRMHVWACRLAGTKRRIVPLYMQHITQSRPRRYVLCPGTGLRDFRK